MEGTAHGHGWTRKAVAAAAAGLKANRKLVARLRGHPCRERKKKQRRKNKTKQDEQDRRWRRGEQMAVLLRSRGALGGGGGSSDKWNRGEVTFRIN